MSSLKSVIRRTPPTTTNTRCLLFLSIWIILFSSTTHAWLYPDTLSSFRSAQSSSVEIDESLDQELLPDPIPLVAEEVVTKKSREDVANEEEENVVDGDGM